MTSTDHRFRPLILDATHCAECRDERVALQHFGEHKGPVVPLLGFTFTPLPRRAARRKP
jgi:hypothetical protein